MTSSTAEPLSSYINKEWGPDYGCHDSNRNFARHQDIPGYDIGCNQKHRPEKSREGNQPAMIDANYRTGKMRNDDSYKANRTRNRY